MKKVYILLVTVLFVALSATAFAFGPGFGSTGKGGYGMYKADVGGFGAGLNLSKDQLDKMWKLREKHRTDTQATRYEMFQKNMELRRMYADPKADDTAILAKQKEVNTLRQKLQDKMTEFKLEQRKILTPEQLTKLNEAMKNFGYRKVPRRHAGRDFGGRGFGPGACGVM